jgi:hypothetical protein
MRQRKETAYLKKGRSVQPRLGVTLFPRHHMS